MCSIFGFCGSNGEYDKIQKALLATKSRGPDDSRIINTGNGWIGFNRLSIMGLTGNGMQPFVCGNRRTYTLSDLQDRPEGYEIPEESGIVLACNGEIYGFRPVRQELIEKGYTFSSESDCEILPALYREHGTDMFRMLDAEFALILYDRKENTWIAAREDRSRRGTISRTAYLPDTGICRKWDPIMTRVCSGCPRTFMTCCFRA